MDGHVTSGGVAIGSARNAADWLSYLQRAMKCKSLPAVRSPAWTGGAPVTWAADTGFEPLMLAFRELSIRHEPLAVRHCRSCTCAIGALDDALRAWRSERPGTVFLSAVASDYALDLCPFNASWRSRGVAPFFVRLPAWTAEYMMHGSTRRMSTGVFECMPKGG